MGWFRTWNLSILDFFDTMLEWLLGIIVNMLNLSPYDFSPGAYNLAQQLGTGLVPFAMYILVLLWGIDFAAANMNFSDKPLETIIKYVAFLAFGWIFTHVSFYLVMGIFDFFGGLINTAIDLTGFVDFSNFTSEVRGMLMQKSGPFYTIPNTPNMIIFVFLIFSFLSFFGMLLGMILVPISIFFELYIYAAFSPIPIATLFTGRKEVGIAFIVKLPRIPPPLQVVG